MKRYRAPKAKPGELKMQWGKLPGDSPDMCFCWGDGCSKRDGALLHYLLASKRQRMLYGEEQRQAGANVAFDPSFIEELEARGYDLTTFKFSIQKKAV